MAIIHWLSEHKYNHLFRVDNHIFPQQTNPLKVYKETSFDQFLGRIAIFGLCLFTLFIFNMLFFLKHILFKVFTALILILTYLFSILSIFPFFESSTLSKDKINKKVFFHSNSLILSMCLNFVLLLICSFQNLYSSWMRFPILIGILPFLIGLFILFLSTGFLKELFKKETPSLKPTQPLKNLMKDETPLPEKFTEYQKITIEEFLISQNMYTSYLHLQYNLHQFFAPLLSIENDFPLIQQMILKEKIYNQSAFKESILSEQFKKKSFSLTTTRLSKRTQTLEQKKHGHIPR